MLPEGTLEISSQKLSNHNAKKTRELNVGLIPEERILEGLWKEESCFHNMIIGLEKNFTHFEFLSNQKIEKVTALWAKNFDVRASSLEIPAQSLSGGNQQKIIFAREVDGRKPELLICHQPTRGVDIAAIQLIYKKILNLRDKGMGILLISSDLDELITLSDRIYIFFEGKVSAEIKQSEFDACKIGQYMLGQKMEVANA